MSDAVTVDAPAKVNLGLAILGRRADGYHDLLSVFDTVSWCDRLTVAEAPEGIALACPGSILPAGAENLVWRAADLFRTHFSVSAGVTITLEKRIPTGAGLGGGSSDAAATLRALATLWRIDAPPEELAALGARIGSDVPFFIHAADGGTAIVEGRGEVVTPLPVLDGLAFVIAVPPIRVSTPWAFGLIRPPYRDHAAYRARVEALKDGRMSLREFSRSIENDFQSPVEERVPIVADLRALLRYLGADVALMSGSGSAVFGIFPNRARAEEARADLPSDIAAVVAESVRPVVI